MADSTKELLRFFLSRENIFVVSFEDFQQFFPHKWRNNEQVKILYEVMQDRQRNAKKRVKENVKDYFAAVRDEEIPDAVEVVCALTQLESHLRKDIKMLDVDIEAAHEIITQYVSYLQARTEEIFEEVCDDNYDAKEFDCLVNDMKLR